MQVVCNVESNLFHIYYRIKQPQLGDSRLRFFSPPWSRPLCEAMIIAKVWAEVRLGPGFSQAGRFFFLFFFYFFFFIFFEALGNTLPRERRRGRATVRCGVLVVEWIGRDRGVVWVVAE